MARPSRRSRGDVVAAAWRGRAREPRAGLMLFLGVATFVVPWGLFIVALLSGPGTGDHDASFIVITLIWALVMTPAAVCVLWPDKHPTGYTWLEDDNGCSGPGT